MKIDINFGKLIWKDAQVLAVQMLNIRLRKVLRETGMPKYVTWTSLFKQEDTNNIF